MRLFRSPRVQQPEDHPIDEQPPEPPERPFRPPSNPVPAADRADGRRRRGLTPPRGWRDAGHNTIDPEPGWMSENWGGW
jgi:hypothetical protein